MCNSAQWWVAFKGGDLPPGRLWSLLLVLGAHYSFVAFNHAMFVFQAFTPKVACQEEVSSGTFVLSWDCQANCSGRYVFPGWQDDSTIVTEWSLVCSRAALRPLMATLYFLGVAVGALSCGLLADRLGRRAVMLGCLLGQAVLGVAVSFAPNLVAFAVLRTLHGVFVQGLQGSTFTLLLELFPGRLRTVVGVALEIYWALGLAVLAGLAYVLPHWRDLQLAVSAPTIVTLLMAPWIPESRLWLASRGHTPPFRRGLPGHGSYRDKKHEEGDASHAVDVSPKLAVKDTAKDDAKDGAEDDVKQLVVCEPVAGATAKDLVTRSGLLLYTLCMNAVWFTVPLSYYVTTFGMPSLTGDRFANFAVGAALEVVAYCLTFVALSRFGRRAPLSSVLASSAVACFAVAFILVGSADDGGVAALVLVLGCKSALVSAFCTMFLYTGELYPTAIRSAALGLCGFVGRVGNLLSPQVVHLGADGRKWAPFVFIGGLLLATAMCTMLLPETLGRELPATLEDARALRRKKRRASTSATSGPEEQPLNANGVLNMEDYKVPEWKSDIPQLDPAKVQTAKKRGSMSALELGQDILQELNRTPCAERAERAAKARSMFLETNLDDLSEGQPQYKSAVASAV
ncbi:solute carrier family 22 member 6-like [Thrips palmi]|uniref:Solute carrier family 22 member 6-like n=1 Tax=Thrips palmi TaxID=161013 RepID=A0A6P8ZYK4_THRPL|nr:solute carrier family 22 member 6-like [Thrips palmi]